MPSRVALLAEAIHAARLRVGNRLLTNAELAEAVESLFVEAEAQARSEGYEQAIADVHKAQDKAYRLAAGTDA